MNQPIKSTNNFRENKSKIIPNNSVQFENFVGELNNWKIKYNDLQLIFNKMSADKDKKIKQLSSELIQIK